jgi:RmuC family
MNELVIAAGALGVGLAAGALLAARRRVLEKTLPPPVEGWLEAHAAELRRLADAARARDGAEERLRADVQATRASLDALRVREDDRRSREVEHAEVIRRLSAVLAGGAGKGRAGENVLEQQLSELPPGMLVADFRVNGKVVEWGLSLPDGRRLPIDSKWPAVRELEILERASDQAERDAAVREVERIVARRAREVAAYLDPAVTAPVAVGAVPDAVYEVLRRAHADAFSHGVVIVPYSCALPVILFLFSLVARYGSVTDVQACLAELAGVLESVEAVVENKIARAQTMLGNGAAELRSEVGRARGSLARARASGPSASPDTHGAPELLPAAEGGDAEELLRAVE